MHYDRLIHFLFGLMIAVPAREIAAMASGPRGLMRYALTAQSILAMSALYELPNG